MKILLIGSGGREHALAWAMAQSSLCDELYCAPGNAGTEALAQNVDLGAEDIEGIVKFAIENSIDLVVVGPEGPLVAGLADRLRAKNIKVFGPSAAAAQLEGSKGFMKDLCAKYNIPTAAYGRFTDLSAAEEFIRKTGAPIVVKADGLAAGKGVIICESEDEAIAAVRDMLSGESFGAAGAEVVVEEFLDGEELSYFALSDGKTVLPLTSAQDHKRVGDGDTGPNTGGMGAYSPAHLMTPEMEQTIIKTLIEPTIKGMAAEGCPFAGVLFAGIMVVDGVPKLLEHNVRFGDPECQTLMLRLEGDLLEILDACADGRLDQVKDKVSWSKDRAICVVMAAEGYPGSYKKNTVIEGLNDAAMQVQDVTIFHAGTARNDRGEIVSIGGRVLGVCATGPSIYEANGKAYRSIGFIDWPEGFCRKDIAWRALAAEKGKAA